MNGLPEAPPVALRTYRFLRISVVVVIAALWVSMVIERIRADCWQGSISAYYYTSTQTIFVGTLITLGIALIVLWGRTPWEDGAFNLAGLMAPVVAFVPTVAKDEIKKCALGDQFETGDIRAVSQSAINNNMLTYAIVVGTALVVLFVVWAIAPKLPGKTGRSLRDPAASIWAFLVPWIAAAILYLAYLATYLNHEAWFRANAHSFSAYATFGFIGIGILCIAIDRLLGGNKRVPGDQASAKWAIIYFALVGAMVAGLLVPITASSIGGRFESHKTLILEMIELTIVAIFWVAQSIDRRDDPAPRPLPTGG